YVTGQWPIGEKPYADYVTLHNPAGLFAAFFKEALARRGIKVAGKARSVNYLARDAQPLATDKLIELGSVESLPLRDLAREILKPSQNLYADLLLCHLGALAHDTNNLAGETSEEAGVRELKKFLAHIGIGTNDVYFEEGSGLSRN